MNLDYGGVELVFGGRTFGRVLALGLLFLLLRLAFLLFYQQIVIFLHFYLFFDQLRGLFFVIFPDDLLGWRWEGFLGFRRRWLSLSLHLFVDKVDGTWLLPRTWAFSHSLLTLFSVLINVWRRLKEGVTFLVLTKYLRVDAVLRSFLERGWLELNFLWSLLIISWSWPGIMLLRRFIRWLLIQIILKTQELFIFLRFLCKRLRIWLVLRMGIHRFCKIKLGLAWWRVDCDRFMLKFNLILMVCWLGHRNRLRWRYWRRMIYARLKRSHRIVLILSRRLNFHLDLTIRSWKIDIRFGDVHTRIDIGFLSPRRLHNRVNRLEFYIRPRWIVMDRCLKLTIRSVFRSLLGMSGVESYFVCFSEIPWRFLVVWSSGVDSGSELGFFSRYIILREGN